jgi:hypothetical protein
MVNRRELSYEPVYVRNWTVSANLKLVLWRYGTLSLGVVFRFGYPKPHRYFYASDR